MLKNRIEYIIFLTFSFIFSFCGLYLSRRFGNVLAVLFYYVIPIRKKVTLRNLSIAFPEYSPKKIKKIAFQCYRSLGIAFSEIFCLGSLKESKIKAMIKSSNVELLQEKHKLGKGVILMTGHYGNWEALAISLALVAGIPFSLIVQTQRNTLVDIWMNKLRTKFGNKTIPLGISIRQIFSEIKSGKIVAIVADQRGPKDGVKVKFFGVETTAISGFANLALKLKVPIVIGFGARDKDYNYVAELEEISTDNLPDDIAGKEQVLTQRHTDILEKHIRRHPEQWFWMHNRFKFLNQ